MLNQTLETIDLRGFFNQQKMLEFLLPKLKKPYVVGLIGHVGAGKTTLVKAIYHYLKQENNWPDCSWEGSPTFNLLHIYHDIWHYDFYRFQGMAIDKQRLLDLDLAEASQNLTFIEWPEPVLELIKFDSFWVF